MQPVCLDNQVYLVSYLNMVAFVYTVWDVHFLASQAHVLQ